MSLDGRGRSGRRSRVQLLLLHAAAKVACAIPEWAKAPRPLFRACMCLLRACTQPLGRRNPRVGRVAQGWGGLLSVFPWCVLRIAYECDRVLFVVVFVVAPGTAKAAISDGAFFSRAGFKIRCALCKLAAKALALTCRLAPP